MQKNLLYSYFKYLMCNVLCGVFHFEKFPCVCDGREKAKTCFVANLCIFFLLSNRFFEKKKIFSILPLNTDYINTLKLYS